MSREFVVFIKRESVLESIAKDTVTFSLLGLCIYISRGSTWWTFLTGGMFILFIAAKINSVYNKHTLKFKTKKELQAWANTLEEDPEVHDHACVGKPPF